MGQDLAEAFRTRQAVALLPAEGDFFYGPNDRMILRAWNALDQGQAIKQLKAQRLKETLKNADVVGMLKDSPPRPIAPGN
jgi:hypothetical protein